MKKGVVLRSTGSSYSIESEGNLYSCKLKGKMRLQNIKSTNPVAVGDNVIFEVDDASKKEVIYIKYDTEKMNFIYLCCNCQTKWKSDEQ